MNNDRRRFLKNTTTQALLLTSSSMLLPYSVPASQTQDSVEFKPQDKNFWQNLQSQFQLLPGLTYMNTGSLGPMPQRVLAASQKCQESLARDPSFYLKESDLTESLRKRASKFCNTSENEMILTRSTTEGMRIFSHGLDLKAGDEILCSSHEYGEEVGLFRNLVERKGVVLKRFPFPCVPQSKDEILKLYRDNITEKTKVLVVSHVTAISGVKLPIAELAEIANQKGILISVDGAHTLGAMNLDLKGWNVHHYAASGQKWLMAGSGTGLAYIRKDMLEKVALDVTYASSFEEPASGRRFERVGQKNIPSLKAMDEAISFCQDIGMQNIETRCWELNAYFREQLQSIQGIRVLTPVSRDLSAGMTLFEITNRKMDDVQAYLYKEHGIFVRTMPKDDINACRASIHIFNTLEQVQNCIEAIRDYVPKS